MSKSAFATRRTKSAGTPVLAFLFLSLVPRAAEVKDQLVLAFLEVVLASDPVRDEHILGRCDRRSILVSISFAKYTVPRALMPIYGYAEGTYEDDIAVGIQPFKDKICALLIQLSRGHLEGCSEVPLGLLDPLQSASHRQHCLAG